MAKSMLQGFNRRLHRAEPFIIIQARLLRQHQDQANARSLAKQRAMQCEQHMQQVVWTACDVHLASQQGLYSQSTAVNST
jgi:hypothetical protein